MDCIFCEIIKGNIPSTTVYEDEYVKAINDLNPQMPVHVLSSSRIVCQTITLMRSISKTIRIFLQRLCRRWIMSDVYIRC